MTNQILEALELGLVYGLMVLGVFITFRILKIPDLTVDGSITLGMAVCAMLTNARHPGIALIVALIADALAGCITAFLQTKAKIAPILAGIMTMSGLYSINLLMMDDGQIVLDLSGEEREQMNVAGLLQKYREIKGKMLDNDRILLS